MLSVYAPVNFGGQCWSMLAEIDRDEVLSKKNPYLPLAAGVLAGLLAMGLIALIWRLIRDVWRPGTPQ